MSQHLFFRELSAADLSGYRSVPFWSWNDKLEPEQLREQIRQMRDAGMGGFFMHARGGLETEYLGEDWFRAVEASSEEAKKCGMQAWCYDENGWPSGFAGGKLLEDPANLAHFLRFKESDRFDPAALGVYISENGKLCRVLKQENSAQISRYYCVYDCKNISTVDILNPEITDAFLRLTHEVYAARYGEKFSTDISGFFTDEPQYFRHETAYSPVMLAAYKERYGRELLEELGALFVDCPQSYGFRFRYWRLMNELYTENFIGRVQKWCRAHGCLITGHSIQEDTLAGQMWCSAGVMPFYEYEDMPGVDWLGRAIGTELNPRQVSSAAQQLGKKHVMTETFACAGWDVTPRELKRIAEFQYVNGVNFMCQHLYPYSIRGQRKRDYPAFYSWHNPWTQELKTFNTYFDRLGYLLANSKEKADVLLIHPMHNAYLTYDRQADEDSVRWISEPWEELIERFGAYGIGHHYGDERLMEKYAEIRDSNIYIGRCGYKYIVIPECETLDHSTADLLREFLRQGGKLWLAGSAPTRIDGENADLAFLHSTVTFEEIRRSTASFTDLSKNVRCTFRTSEIGDFLYVVNLSEKRIETDTETEAVILRLPFVGAVRAELLTEKIIPLDYEKTSEEIMIPLTLRPGESAVILRDDTAEPQKENKKAPTPLLLDKPMKIVGNPENALTLDMVALSYDGMNYTDPLPVPSVSERLLRERTNRTVWLKYKFNVEDLPEKLMAEIESLKETDLFFNGAPLTAELPGILDSSFVRADLTELVHTGLNELVLKIRYYQSEKTYKVFNGFYYGNGEITETLMNCVSYETNIESVYLFGSFSVRAKTCENMGENILMAGEFSICAPRTEVLPRNITQQGYYFFRGSMKLQTVITVDDPNKCLKLEGRGQFARVKINGKDAGTLLLENTLDLSGYLMPGENTLELELMASNRNLFGPHHNAVDPEPLWVDPTLFSLYGTWRDGHSSGYRDSYAFVPFGI